MRHTVKVGEKTTVKRFGNQDAFERELSAYFAIPWACPKLAKVGDGWIEIETLPAADASCTCDLWALLERIASFGWHHRDVTIKNVLYRDTNPVLIDWECAVHDPGKPSYDLYGPASGVEPASPKGYAPRPQWWGADLNTSIGKHWGYPGRPGIGVGHKL